jgi:torulene dioxygenase
MSQDLLFELHSPSTPSGSNGELYNYVFDLAAPSATYSVFEIDKTGTGRIIANITDAPMAYIHSMFSTEHYIVMIIWQADFDNTKVTYNIADSLKPWNSTRQTLFCKGYTITFSRAID